MRVAPHLRTSNTESVSLPGPNGPACRGIKGQVEVRERVEFYTDSYTPVVCFWAHWTHSPRCRARHALAPGASEQARREPSVISCSMALQLVRSALQHEPELTMFSCC